ncbi:MAG TPA: GHMP kinase [Candidatus Hydrogenedentes bacterium]|nr:GHMP kinase [Candidatus Hydrogenedentota bacterium]HOS01612.1 GHMP kinase [Candidatus Hydrogenedentota bacterium]
MIITRAPLRVSFLGGGTDYPEYFLRHGGAILGTAIDKFSYITASAFYGRLFDYAIRLSYRKPEIVNRIDEIEHPVFRESLRYCGIDRDIELHTVADLPAFTGLGSSSSFTVALLHALHAFRGEFRTPQQLMYEAIHVERHLLQDPVGCQDQALAAFGGFNLIEFHAEDDIRVHRAPIAPERLRELEQHLFLVFTGIRRRAADVVVGQLARLDENRSVLADMRRMVDQGWDILVGARPWQEFGQLLHKTWLAKQSLDAGVSNPAIDALCRRGLDAGAWAAKLLGAGGGGFILFFAPPELRPALERAFASHPCLSVAVNAPGSEVIFS